MEYSKEDLMEAKKQIWGVGENMGTEESKKNRTTKNMQENHFKRTTVTAALPYANGGVHIGHLAGVYVPADIYVRYLRLKKQEVIFIGGSDEHGVPITLRAKKEGKVIENVYATGSVLSGLTGPSPNFVPSGTIRPLTSVNDAA